MKKLLIAILVGISFLMTSCAVIEGETKERIVAPENNLAPITGKWEVTELVYSLSSINNQDEATNIGESGLFHKDGVVLGQDYTSNPSFKIKKVRTRDYLISKFKLNPASLQIEDDYIKVITILNEDQYFTEFIEIDQDTMLVYLNESFYRLERQLEEVSLDEVERYINVEKNVQRNLGEIADESLSTGLLLGIKTQGFDDTYQIPTWEYKTYWINMQNRSLEGLYELDRLLLPRKNGFWFIDQERNVENGIISDEIEATPLFTPENNSEIMEAMVFDARERSLFEERPIPSILKNILFVGNDYISVENIELDREDRRTLQVYAIDNLAEKKPIKLSDLIGDTGRDLFQEGVRSVAAIDDNIMINEENVGLVRRNGYWTLKGRINYKENEKELYKDFNIKAIPPKEMVSYDELAIPWDAVKLTVPDVEDVFSSPSNEFIVVITTSHIVIYSLEEYDINNTPVARIRLPNDSTVIMSEWGVGRYPQIWQNEMIKHGATEIER
ncbi:hypothetical protein [Gudongella sp. DL1XJH-153]|uniref:hypothetical protein n=1 Tax=Gudongella sp. DL1XJH-153 TaxID=3409804 RepID=UPI003BB740E2